MTEETEVKKKVKITPEQFRAFSILTKKQRHFVMNLISGMDKIESYKKAYPGVIESSVAPSVIRLLKVAKIKNALIAFDFQSVLDGEIEEEIEKAIMTRQEALLRLSEIGRGSIGDLGSVKVIERENDEGKKERVSVFTLHDEIDDSYLRNIRRISQSRFGPALEMYNAVEAIDRIADLQGWKAAQKIHTTGQMEIDLEPETIDEQLSELGYEKRSMQLENLCIEDEEMGEAENSEKEKLE